MLITIAYQITRKLLNAMVTVARRDVSKDAALLVLRHENTVLRRLWGSEMRLRLAAELFGGAERSETGIVERC